MFGFAFDELEHLPVASKPGRLSPLVPVCLNYDRPESTALRILLGQGVCVSCPSGHNYYFLFALQEVIETLAELRIISETSRAYHYTVKHC